MQHKPIAKAIVTALLIFASLQLVGVAASVIEWIVEDGQKLKRVPGYIAWIGNSYLGNWFGATALFELVALSITTVIACVVYVKAASRSADILERKRLSDNFTRKDIASGDDGNVPTPRNVGGFDPNPSGSSPFTWPQSRILAGSYPLSEGGAYEQYHGDADDVRDDDTTRGDELSDIGCGNDDNIRPFGLKPRHQQGHTDDID